MKTFLLLRLNLLLLKNRFAWWVSRLRRPRYLVGGLAGAAYLVAVLRPWDRGFWVAVAGGPKEADPRLLAALEIGLAALVTLFALIAWVWPARRAALEFSEAEIAFLFPAPLTRREVVTSSILKSQIGLAFSALVTSFFALRLVAGSFLRAFLTAWIAFSALHLYWVAVAIVRSNLLRHGAAAWRGAWPTLLAIGIAAGSTAAGFAFGSLRTPTSEDFSNLSRYVIDTGGTPPLLWLLLPARAIVHPLFAGSAGSFLLSLLPALALVALLYLWAVRSDFEYEEASVQRAAQRAERAQARRRGERRFERVSTRGRRTPFTLGATGCPVRALLWKNVTATWRITLLPYILVVLAAIAAASIAFASALHASVVPQLAAGLGFQCLVFAGVFVLIGPEIVRTDLRMDLLHADLLKSYPLPGPALVLGEVLTPTLVATLAGACLLAAAVPLLHGVNGWSSGRWAILAAAGLVILVPLNLLVTVIHNAGLIIFPSWHHLGAGRGRGFDVLGQVIVGAIVRTLALALALLPAAVAFALLLLAGWPFLGWPAIPVGAAGAAGIALIEGILGIHAVGLLFERFDPSLELDLSA